MSARLSLTSFIAALQTALPTAYVGTVYDGDYVTKYGKPPFPQVWIGGQRAMSMDKGTGYSSLFRQTWRIDLTIRTILGRYNDDANLDGDGVNAFFDSVVSAIIATTPDNADIPLYLQGTQDGPASETVVVLDFVFTTEITVQVEGG